MPKRPRARPRPRALRASLRLQRRALAANCASRRQYYASTTNLLIADHAPATCNATLTQGALRLENCGRRRRAPGPQAAAARERAPARCGAGAADPSVACLPLPALKPCMAEPQPPQESA